MNDVPPGPLCRAVDCRTTPTDDYAGRGLCEVCERRARNIVAGLPATFRQLLPLIRERRARGLTGVPVRGKPGPQILIDVDVEALAGEIKYVAVMWAETIRHRAGLSDHPRETVESASAILGAWWTAFISAPADGLTLYDRTIIDQDGIDGVNTLAHLARRAHYVIGQNPGLILLPGLCPGEKCGRPDLRHIDGNVTVWCGTCHRVWHWNEYASHVELVTVGWVDHG